MCKLFDEWKAEIKQYCDQNGLNFDVAQKWKTDKDNVGVKYFWEFWKSFKRARRKHLYLNICHPRVRRYCMVRACNAIATPAARR